MMKMLDDMFHFSANRANFLNNGRQNSTMIKIYFFKYKRNILMVIQTKKAAVDDFSLHCSICNTSALFLASFFGTPSALFTFFGTPSAFFHPFPPLFFAHIAYHTLCPFSTHTFLAQIFLTPFVADHFVVDIFAHTICYVPSPLNHLF